MEQFFTSTTNRFSNYRRGALLLALVAVGPAAWGQIFGPVSLYPTGAGSQPVGVAMGDMNGDGRPDIVTANYAIGTAGVLLGQAGGSFASVSTYSTGAGGRPWKVAVGDVNGDGVLDIVMPNMILRNVGVLLGQPGGGFGPLSSYSTGPTSHPNDVALGDVNADGRLDIVLADDLTDGVDVLLGQAGGGFAAVSTYTTGPDSNASCVALGDVDDDGRLDIVVGNNNSGAAAVLLAQPGGGFFAVSRYSMGSIGGVKVPNSIALGDVNGDNRSDIVASIINMGETAVLLGQAGGSFATVNTYPAVSGSYPLGIALGDVNGDGRLDIVLAHSGNDAASVLMGQAGGSFAAPVLYSTGAGSVPHDIALADVNGDGRLDMITANSGSNTVGVFLNTGTFTPLATTRPTAAEVSLAPNPAHEAFTVQLPASFQPTQAALLNALGQVVRRPAAAGAHFQVETAGLTPGVYTLRLYSGEAVLAKRVAVQ
ncbi:T9SS type A sorting domain-containing protein [Hymenobacter ruricola]|uniref:T9SS type A sorting domain-containing protein n=1 Tax=Hymenobacter ruricola TaxID=2791023 RepID=A0ABS0I403_9BACT|nr:T9SS type A sorting domain-containing protein [Hymenobacter ruricola]MBF9221458.1 T9SS type A sorting domain-containing protein [Hymenobacter ruricola]